MNEDIWTKKPSSSAAGTLSDMFLHVYDKESMDTWLEKLKTHEEEQEKAIGRLNTRIIGYWDKLEAIKGLVIKWREQVKTYPDDAHGLFAKVTVELCANELEKILEVEK